MSATISPSSTRDLLPCDASFLRAVTISGNCCALSLPLRVTSFTSDDVAYARTRIPSYFGSNVQPSPGTSLPTLAYIGSSTADEVSLVGDLATDLGAVGFAVTWVARRLAEGSLVDTPGFFGSRLLLQTLLLPDAISSIVRFVSTDVMFSATTSSSVAN